MSTHSETQLRMIADLPNLSENIPGLATMGYPEDFSALFARSGVRLLRNALGIKIRDGVVAFHHSDVRELAAHPALGMPTEFPHVQRFFRNLIFTTNPPLHGPMRQVISRPLSPINVARIEQLARQVAVQLVDEVTQQGEIDFSSEFSERFTARFWGQLFELTHDEIERLATTVRGIALLALIEPTAEESAALTASMDRYMDLVGYLMNRALSRGSNPLLESMASAFNLIEHEAKPHCLQDVMAANIFEGLHTAAAACSNVLYQLLLSPEHLAAVRSDQSLIGIAVAEGLRLSGPAIDTHRRALQDLEFASTMIPKDTVITMLLAAGNRDPLVFEDPNRYDLFRKQQPALTFGGGVHICPGRHVVGLLGRTMLKSLVESGAQIELSGDRPTWVKRLSMRQLNGLKITIRRT